MDGPGSFHVFFAVDGLLNNDWYTSNVVYAVSEGAFVYDYYDNGWQQAPLLYPR